MEAAPTAAYQDSMMEEVSMAMAYDAHAIDQMSEEEILACLVAETEPKFTVRLSRVIVLSVFSNVRQLLVLSVSILSTFGRLFFSVPKP